eukprot:TRINITY_DN1599_c0_g1_i5.p1 TRINITY_DN1599_c0_g1~~TRINITY_DN1599_c0_g1_i5.p1  ORF type:complete len:916 (+),score=260.01 TRINITY_DN1599_c0_g1_i5:60-2807(+)
MPLIPIKWATTFMTCACTLLAVGIAMIVSILATDKALDDVKSSQDANVANCFQSGETNLVEITDDKIKLLATKVELSVQSQLNEARLINQVMMGLGMTINDPSDDYQVRAVESSIVKMWDSSIISILGFMAPAATYVLVENSLSYEVNAELSFRHENSTNYLIYNESTALKATVGMIDHLEGTYSSNTCNITECLLKWTGEVASGPCPLSFFNPYDIPVAKDAQSQTMNTAKWSKVISFSTYVGTIITSRFSRDPSSPAHSLIGIVGFDLKSITSYLRRIVSPAGDERFFLVVGGKSDQSGLLLGASHGSWYTYELGTDPIIPSRTIELKTSRHCTNSTDSVIQGVSQWLYAQVSLGDDPFVAQELRQKNESQVVAVEGNEHYLQLAELKDEYGLEWWVAVVVEKASVVGATRERRNTAVAAIATSNSKVDSDMSDNRVVLICVVCGLTLVLMLVTAVVTTNLTKPLGVLSDEMWDVAELRLDDVDEKAKQSSLLEVNSMQRSFLMMLHALREYRQFMPQAVANMDASDSDANEGEISSEGETHISTPQRSSITSGTGTGGKSGMEFSSPTDRKSSGTGNTNDKYRSKKYTSHALALYMTRKKNVCQVAIENCDFERLITDKKDGSSIVEYHSQWLQRCISDVKDHRGTVERFIGDHIDINFGGAVPCPSASAKAANYAVKLREKMTPIECRRSFAVQSDLIMLVGMSTGVCYAGNLGCFGMKAPATLGRAFMMAKDMLFVARDVGVDIVMDAKCADELKGMFTTTVVEILKEEDRGKTLCSYLNGLKKDVGGEWMYTMRDESEVQFDAAWTHVLAGEVAKGLSELQMITPAHPVLSLVISRLSIFCEMVEKVTGKPPTDYYRCIAQRAVNGVLAEQYLPAPRLVMSSRQRPRTPMSGIISDSGGAVSPSFLGTS